MKDNTEKCYLMLSTGDSNQIQMGEFIDLSSLREKPFAVKFVKICQLLINTSKGYVRKGMQN